MKHKQFIVPILVVMMAVLSLAVLPAQAQTASWTATYYNNLFLQDPPVLNTTATQLTFDWGNGSPAGVVNNNNWSARFGTDVFFNAATYRFSVRADDEVRLWIDGQSVINTFDAGQPNTILTADLALSGNHHIQVDYRERSGAAVLNVTWQDVRAITATPTCCPTTPVTGITATVNTYTLNVRNAPNLSGLVLTKIARGQVYTVLGKTSDSIWVKLDVLGQQGWASAAYLVVSNIGAVPVVDTAPVGVNPSDSLVQTAVRLNFRSGPSTTSASQGILASGTTLKVIGRNADASWLKVEYAGKQGWVALAFVRAVTALNFANIPIVG